MIAVPTPVNHLDLAVYSRAPEIATRSRAEIASMRIAYPRGAFVYSKYTKGMSTIEAQSMSAAIDLVVNQRVDVALLPYVGAEQQFAAGVLRLHRWPQLWASEPSYLLLNRRHEALVPRLDAALQQMKREGLIEKIYLDGLRSIGIRQLMPEDTGMASAAKSC